MPNSDDNQVSTCPRCFAAVLTADGCDGCGLRFQRRGGLLDVLGAGHRESQAAGVEEFYTANPFPGYAPADDVGSLLDRSRRSLFLRRLDAAIAPTTRVLDCGCGTGQLAAFLALAGPNRQVFGMDGCRRSLELGEQFRADTEISNLQLVRADLFDLPIRPQSFDVVVSRGVVHHTPDPYRALAAVAGAVAPGGYLVIGFYESLARVAHRMRRALATLSGRPVRWLDPVLRRRDLDEEKKRIWTEDQYHHPLEHVLPLPRVVRALDELGFSWVRTVPSLEEDSILFEPTTRPSAPRMRRVAWMLRGVHDPDAGLVFYIARRS